MAIDRGALVSRGQPPAYSPAMPESNEAERTLEALDALLEVIARLRAPNGCPWDREQTTKTMAPHLLEEAHEAADAVRRRHPIRAR